jgi:hypothetical protein
MSKRQKTQTAAKAEARKPRARKAETKSESKASARKSVAPENRVASARKKQAEKESEEIRNQDRPMSDADRVRESYLDRIRRFDATVDGPVEIEATPTDEMGDPEDRLAIFPQSHDVNRSARTRNVTWDEKYGGDEDKEIPELGIDPGKFDKDDFDHEQLAMAAEHYPAVSRALANYQAAKANLIGALKKNQREVETRKKLNEQRKARASKK